MPRLGDDEDVEMLVDDAAAEHCRLVADGPRVHTAERQTVDIDFLPDIS